MEGKILLPPSPNWFLSNAMDSRSEDGLIVTASFKSIVIYQTLQDGGLPTILKVIPYGNEKVQQVRLYPDASHPVYGRTIASCGEGSSQKLTSLDTGEVLWHHKEQDVQLTGVAWGRYGEEPAVITVDAKGRLVVWQPKPGVTLVHKVYQVNVLTCIEVNPDNPSQALVGGEKSLFLVELRDGNVLMQFHGHNYDIYCLKWLPGECSPFSSDVGDGEAVQEYDADVAGEEEKGSESENWRNRPQPSSSTGPFFASSDFGRQIFLWDLSAKRYISRVTVPVGASMGLKKTQGKDKIQGKHHIALTWYKGELVSSTSKGELLLWSLWPGGGRFKTVHHLHSRALYNVEIIGDVAVTSGQDRVLHGYDLVTSSHLFQFPSLGACASTFAFCPQDINRLAIGSQECNIRFLNFESEVPLQAQVVWQNIKGKILSISWHPEKEGRLLYGTGLGQVGWVDMSSGRPLTFAYYHQKAVYKVEWAPAVCPEKISLRDSWCAYSFGDREIIIRSTSDLMADPIQLLPLLSENGKTKTLKDVTEFAFSCDYKYLAIGSSDGQVHIFRSSNLELTVSLFVLRKAIQHLLWQPPSSSSFSDILAVGSNENKVCLFDLSSHLRKETNDVKVLTQATRELCGHESRVVWLSWSPHRTEVLASASYDHTVQLWDTITGEALFNYGGHITRVFRVEFSPSDPDLMYSFAEENSIHMWRPSQLTCKSPLENAVRLKEIRLKKQKEYAEEQAKEESALVTTEKSSTPASSTLVTTNKKLAYKSFFPKLHNVCSRKKSFFHIITMNLLAQRKESTTECQKETEELEEELADELEESNNTKENGGASEVSNIDSISCDYSFLLEKDTEMPPVEDIAYALSIYGKPLQMDSLLTTEISEHAKRGNDIQADLMHCWQGSLDDHIRAAARQKKLTSFLVASAPQVSIKLWEFASEAYAGQLVEEGDAISAATYLVNIDKVEEAVNLLVKHRFFREAIAIAKCRRGYSEELVSKVTAAWTVSTVLEGAFDFAATLQVSMGQIEEAARTMARRNDHGSLFIASQLYAHAGKKDLSKSIGLLSLKEACLKQEYDKIHQFLSYLPELKWFRVICCCHSIVSEVLQESSAPACSLQYFSKKKRQETSGKEVESENSAVSGDASEPSAAENGDTSEELPVLQYVKEEWVNQGITNSPKSELYEMITSSFSTQQMPTSVKQLWFLVSVELCKLMTSPSSELCELHLMTALNYGLSWGKADQIYHLTRLLLPKGSSDFTTLACDLAECQAESSKALGLLRMLYQVSELCLLHSELQNDDVWTDLINGQKESEAMEAVVKSEPADISENQDALLESAESSTNGGSRVGDEEEIKSQTSEVNRKGTLASPAFNSTTELLNALHKHTDYLLENEDIHGLMEKISESVGNLKKMLLDVSMKLKEKGDLNDEDVQILICKVSSLKSSS